MALDQSTTSDSYASRTLTAFFDSQADAEEAIARLKDLGIVHTSIRLVGGDEYSSAGRSDDKGFWESLSDFFFPEDDRAAYAEGLRRGGYLVTVNDIRADLYDEALDILDDEGSVDLDERQNNWRSEGWTGNAAADDFMPVPGDAGMASLPSDTSATARGMAHDTSRTMQNETKLSMTDDSIAARRMADNTTMGDNTMRSLDNDNMTRALDSDDEVIPVVEEQLRVGKRDVNLGRVRVRSYVVEEPVTEQVNLREDRVTIERRPVDRALTGDEIAFTDKTIEAEEHAEEAVVSKQARVREEIALRRDTTDRTETVSDTVRRTEVEVEDERAMDAKDRTMKRKA